MNPDDISELRLIVWDMLAQFDRLRRRIGDHVSPETKRLLNRAAEELREAHLALYFAQVELARDIRAGYETRSN